MWLYISTCWSPLCHQRTLVGPDESPCVLFKAVYFEQVASHLHPGYVYRCYDARGTNRDIQPRSTRVGFSRHHHRHSVWNDFLQPGHRKSKIIRDPLKVLTQPFNRCGRDASSPTRVHWGRCVVSSQWWCWGKVTESAVQPTGFELQDSLARERSMVAQSANRCPRVSVGNLETSHRGWEAGSSGGSTAKKCNALARDVEDEKAIESSRIGTMVEIA